jgi:hypothetical protein
MKAISSDAGQKYGSSLTGAKRRETTSFRIYNSNLTGAEERNATSIEADWRYDSNLTGPERKEN